VPNTSGVPEAIGCFISVCDHRNRNPGEHPVLLPRTAGFLQSRITCRPCTKGRHVGVRCAWKSEIGALGGALGKQAGDHGGRIEGVG
jgi:hypothetical protein